MQKTILIVLACALAGCSTLNELRRLPKSQGESNANYSYIPLDPLPVMSVAGPSCGPLAGLDISTFDEIAADDGKKRRVVKDLLTSLPDNAVRMAVRQVSGNLKLTFGASTVGEAGNRYQVVLDYINVDSTNIRFFIATNPLRVTRLPDKADFANPALPSLLANKEPAPESNIVIPVYVGVGLRLTADITVNSGTLNLASLGAIAAGVEAGRAAGSLVVQTIGVTGKQVSVSLPMPSELNQTTVQNAILALGSIKAIIYDEKSTTITPRVTGIYLPLADGSEELVNKIVSELARYPITWSRACTYAQQDVPD